LTGVIKRLFRNRGLGFILVEFNIVEESKGPKAVDIEVKDKRNKHKFNSLGDW